MVKVTASAALDMRDLDFPDAGQFQLLSIITSSALSLGNADGSFLIAGPFVQGTDDDAITRMEFRDPDEVTLAAFTGINGVDESDLASLFAGTNDTAILGRILSGRDTIGGSGEDDALFGFRGADKMRGGSGDDRLDGSGGKDKLFGGSGDDDLRGGGGNDKLVGGTGDDTLIGGGGRDSFVFNPRSGNDVIRDFQDGADRIVLKAADGIDDLIIAQDGDDVTIGFRNIEIVLRGTDFADIGADDFSF